MIFEKIRRIQSSEEFNNRNIEGIFITKPQNITYLLGFKVVSDAFVFLPQEEFSHKYTDGKVLLFLLSWEADLVERNIGQNNNIEIIKIVNPSIVKRKIKRLRLESVGFEDDYISTKRLESFKSYFNIKNLVGASDIINNARTIKNDKEIGLIRKACEIGDIGFKKIMETIEDGVTERDLAIEAEYCMLKAGAEGFAYDIIVASGANTLFPHIAPTKKKIENGDLIIVDFGPKFKEYCSDITRTFIFGNHSNEKKELIQLVKNAQQYALNNIKSGISGHDIDKLARDFFISEKKEWGKYFIHNLGHGVGIEVPEPPYLSPVSNDHLKENMIITIEPALYHPSIGGARIEDVILIKKDGYESLSKSKKIYFQ